jgi:hypothetical protein
VKTKIAAGAAIAAVLAGGLGLASPASAENATPGTIALEKTTYYGTGVEAHKDFTVKGADVMRHSYIANGVGSDAWTGGSLTKGQVKKLENTLDLDALFYEAHRSINATCGGGAPTTVWVLRYEGITVSEPTCDGSLPQFKKHLSQAASIITKANFTAPPPAGR